MIKDWEVYFNFPQNQPRSSEIPLLSGFVECIFAQLFLLPLR